jgi:hypothetical protein
MNKAFAIAFLALGVLTLVAAIIYGAWHQLFFAGICAGMGIALYPRRKKRNNYMKFTGTSYYPKSLLDTDKLNKN